MCRRIRHESLLIAGLCVFVTMSGCTTSNSFNPFQPTRTASVRILNSGDRPISGPQGYVILVRGSPRNQAACEAVANSLDISNVHGAPDSRVVPLYWADGRNGGSDRNSFECADRVAHFDYHLSDNVIENLQEHAALGTSVRGPVLIAMRNDHTLGYALDLSGVPDDGLETVIAKWRHEMLQNPKDWSVDHFTAELIRQRLRETLFQAAEVVAVLVPTSVMDDWLAHG